MLGSEISADNYTSTMLKIANKNGKIEYIRR